MKHICLFITLLVMSCSKFLDNSNIEVLNITQLPENPYEVEDYKIGHPAKIEYKLKNGYVRTILFEASGEIIFDSWEDNKRGDRSMGTDKNATDLSQKP